MSAYAILGGLDEKHMESAPRAIFDQIGRPPYRGPCDLRVSGD